MTRGITPGGYTVDLFAGPGGWDEGARILGGPDLLGQLAIRGHELDRHAAATARAAGHHRHDDGTGGSNVRAQNPREAHGATGLIASAPCPTFSDGGKRSGLGDDYQRALDAITALGPELVDYVDEHGEEWTEYGPTPGAEADEFADIAAHVEDPRTALVVETARWALQMPDLEWMVAEQVPAVEPIWESIVAELSAAGWEWFDVVTFDAAQLGNTARRKRTFLAGRRYSPSGVALPCRGHQYAEAITTAEALGWGSGERIRTRSNRRPTGGNLFDADGSCWCLTGKARSWERDSDGLKLTASEAGYLNGFPRDYPWTGKRTPQFQQAGDVVVPPAAAAVLGAALGIPWEEPLRAWALERQAEARGELALAV